VNIFLEKDEAAKDELLMVKIVQSSVLVWITPIAAIYIGLIVGKGDDYVNLQLFSNNINNYAKKQEKQNHF